MIKAKQVPLDINTIINNYPKNGIELEMLTILDKSSSTYDYSSIEELNFELNLRREIVQSANDLYKSRMDFAVFRKTKCNEAFWERTEDGGFLLKSDVKPSDAITDIFKNGQLYATECATAMVIVYYKALLNVMGEATFNRLFKKIHLMNWHYIDNRLVEIGHMRKVNDYLPGDRRYFANPDVDPETPEWQGENALNLSEKLYYGHGIGIKEASAIIESLNSNRKKDATKIAYLMETAARPDFKALFKLI
ncbi:MAG: protein-glutamine gamma-glutamyltransferase [Oscillospiraceae bacterium]